MQCRMENASTVPYHMATGVAKILTYNESPHQHKVVLAGHVQTDVVIAWMYESTLAATSPHRTSSSALCILLFYIEGNCESKFVCYHPGSNAWKDGSLVLRGLCYHTYSKHTMLK